MGQTTKTDREKQLEETLAWYVRTFQHDHQHTLRGEPAGDCVHCKARALLGLPVSRPAPPGAPHLLDGA